ncbi:MAG TPA: TerC family protein [Usitatibacter sp.]|nr:TerC family protein [Usitatibacter sp.]
MPEFSGMSEAIVALAQIMFINVILSGDNAVVIALACRRLSPRHQKQAFIWGSVGVVVLMVVLTVFVVYLLSLPYLEIVGSLMLLWIGIKLLVAEDEGDGEDGVAQKDTLMAAVRTIIIADMIMSLDNVLAMAAAAKGHMWMLIVGLVVTVPVILFGSALLMKLMERFPIFVMIGAALIGWVAGEMIVTDPAIKDWVEANMSSLHTIAPVVCAALVIGVGKTLEHMATRKAGGDIALP